MALIKLKNLIENLQQESVKSSLTVEEKKRMYETIKNYNQYRKSLKAESVYSVIDKINDAIELAEVYALNESSDWMEAKMIKDDIREMKKISGNLYKESQKIKEVEKQIELLYEQLGMKLERYFEIKDNEHDSKEM